MRITIIDRHTLLANCVALVLEGEGYVVTSLPLDHPRTSLATVLGAALRSAGRLVLLEHDLGTIDNGLRLIAPLTAAGGTVVLLTDSVDQAQWGAAVRCGAQEVLHKSCSLDQLVHTVHRAREGRPLMNRERRTLLIEAAIADQHEVRAIRLRLERLTPRETQVLSALMNGEVVHEIARTGVVSEATVRSQVKSILCKLELRSQIAAVGAAYRAAWYPPAA
ncbi:DNA-binding response regulator [Pimelobacter simplex]|uniref:LuxR C-terminal-related transcriptional regulator n=1 Tax=Nocardioides simplex TaxID=2045 RepID=UPI000535B775|nr:LuxR C-terminal-related transcriptional regulator [Pimelobacter simplex]MCG8154548.1 DNA-binding response regulator [Pimelobacter simplex]